MLISRGPPGEIFAMKWCSRSILSLLIVALYGWVVQASGFDGRKLSEKQKNTIQPMTIYGKDDRKESYEVEDAQVQEVGSAVAALINKRRFRLNAKGEYVLKKSKSYGDSYGLCRDEKYYEQPAESECSGFAVGPNLIATAGHCLKKTECKSYYWVFGYEMLNAQKTNRTFEKSLVYKCENIVRVESNNGEDWALIQLDRELENIRPLRLAENSNLGRGTRVMTIGYPLGLPKKFSMEGWVRKWSSSHVYFTTSVDVSSGNSGSPVLNADTLEVEGVLVRGDKDTERDHVNSCDRIKRCGEFKCDGEDVTNISFVIQALQEHHFKP